MLGRHLRLSIDLIMERPEEESPQLTTSYANHLFGKPESICSGKLEDIHQFARELLRQTSDRMKERYDLSSQGRPWSVEMLFGSLL